jgi:ribosomal protein S18 acetylase RimI-like enzyme
MYSLAVDKKWEQKGIASALVQSFEQFVSNTHDLCVKKRLCLRLRKTNHAENALYKRLGYREMMLEVIQLSNEDINSGLLEDGELILFAKDLPISAECSLD